VTKLRLDQCGDVLSVRELELILGIGRNGAYEFAKKIGQRIGTRIFIPKSRLERFLSTGQ
jgi:Helix-turn-helix domain